MIMVIIIFYNTIHITHSTERWSSDEMFSPSYTPLEYYETLGMYVCYTILFSNINHALMHLTFLHNTKIIFAVY